MNRRHWPDGRRFAFTVFDDTDWATVEKVKPVYDLLSRLGMRTTKSVWMFQGDGEPGNGGSTCEDPEYRNWVLGLQREGFEIGLHNAAPGTSLREATRAALDRFRDIFSDQTLIHCNHAGCREGIYWGDARVSGWRRPLYNLLTRGRNQNLYRGHVEGDPLFWGDLCQQRVRYVRNFVFDEVDTLSACPQMPYHDRDRPFVNFWFASTNGSSLRHFLRNFTLAKIDRLVATGGLCIAYVHFAGRFVRNGEVDPEFQRRMEYVASKNGWFAPVSEVLDYLRGGAGREDRVISPAALRRLEARWLAAKALRGTS